MMIWTLVKKDIARFRRNWLTVVILLAVPIGITAVLGLVFGPAARSGQLPRIKLAIVDEDQSLLGSLLTGSVGNDQASKFFDPVFADREVALGLLNNDQISAVVVLPAGFTDAFFEGDSPAPVELIKNPAQRYMPAIVEELLSLLVEGLNALSRNLMSEFPDLIEVFEEDGAPDAVKMADAITRIGKKFEQAEDYLFPPLITYDQQTRQTDDDEHSGGTNMFAFVLPGMAAMFMLFIADGTLQEVYREQQARTLARYRTIRYHLFPFIASKGLYSLTVMLMSALVLLGGGAIIFQISWKHPLPMTLLTIAYCVFCVGFLGLLTALMMSEKRAAMLNSVVILLMAFLGGNIITANGLPNVLRNTISVWMPNYWFNQAIISLEFGTTGPNWVAASIQLLILGTVLVWISASLFTRRLAAGTTA